MYIKIASNFQSLIKLFIGQRVPRDIDWMFEYDRTLKKITVEPQLPDLPISEPSIIRRKTCCIRTFHYPNHGEIFYILSTFSQACIRLYVSVEREVFFSSWRRAESCKRYLRIHRNSLTRFRRWKTRSIHTTTKDWAIYDKKKPQIKHWIFMRVYNTMFCFEYIIKIMHHVKSLKIYVWFSAFSRMQCVRRLTRFCYPN